MPSPVSLAIVSIAKACVPSKKLIKYIKLYETMGLSSSSLSVPMDMPVLAHRV